MVCWIGRIQNENMPMLKKIGYPVLAPSKIKTKGGKVRTLERLPVGSFSYFFFFFLVRCWQVRGGTDWLGLHREYRRDRRSASYRRTMPSLGGFG